MDIQRRNREIAEAIEAGKRAWKALDKAESCLDSAKGFGIWDMIGGGFLSSALKHSKVDDAQRYMEQAQRELSNFSRELRDVQMHAEIRVDFGGLVKGFDMFCDNFLVDVMVQSKINENRRNVRAAKQKVEDTIRKLEQMRRLNG